MNRNAILSKRQKQFIERIAWGASYKEVADFFHVSWSTVDNTLRNAKTKLGLSKVTELGAWWFCTNYGISFDLSPIAQAMYSRSYLTLVFPWRSDNSNKYIIYHAKSKKTTYRVSHPSTRNFYISTIYY